MCINLHLLLEDVYRPIYPTSFQQTFYTSFWVDKSKRITLLKGCETKVSSEEEKIQSITEHSTTDLPHYLLTNTFRKCSNTKGDEKKRIRIVEKMWKKRIHLTIMKWFKNYKRVINGHVQLNIFEQTFFSSFHFLYLILFSGAAYLWFKFYYIPKGKKTREIKRLFDLKCIVRSDNWWKEMF